MDKYFNELARPEAETTGRFEGIRGISFFLLCNSRIGPVCARLSEGLDHSAGLRNNSPITDGHFGYSALTSSANVASQFLFL